MVWKYYTTKPISQYNKAGMEITKEEFDKWRDPGMYLEMHVKAVQTKGKEESKPVVKKPSLVSKFKKKTSKK